MSQRASSTERRLPARRSSHLMTDHCFWSTDSLLISEVQSRTKSTCSSSSISDDQKGDSHLSSGSDTSLKKDPVLNVLHINEPLMNIINKEQGDSVQQSVSDENVSKSDDHSRIEDPVKLSAALVEPENKNKLVNRALELAQSLFGPDTTIVKTFQANPIHRNHDFEDDVTQIFRLEGKGQDDKLEETDGTKDESSSHGVDTIDSFRNRITSSALNAQASLLNRSDFTALEVLNAIYRDAPVGGSRFVKPTSTTFSYMPQNAKARTQLKTKASTSASMESEQSTHERDEEVLYQRQRDLMDEYFHRPGDLRHMKIPFGRQGQLWADQKYYEYYEYLCKATYQLPFTSFSPPFFPSKMSIGSFDLDCGAGSVHTPSNQQANGICRAMKSNLYYQYSPGPEIYSRKVFVGGLPIDIDEDELTATFSRFGPLVVDWPNKGENKSYFPPKGYVFLIFEYEVSVRALVQSCFVEDEKLFLYISSPLSPDKLVQIRPWRLADADYVVEASIPLYARRAVFVGGVPRPIKAVELAHIMDRLYGSVGCAGIDTDVEYKYPKGAGRIAFTNQNSYMKAITDRYVQLSHGEVEKRVELKPYVLDDQPCDECGGERCGHRHAPFFCPQLSCLQYYCEKCWTMIHGCRAREDHKPLVKEA
uniref:Cytoplasmic polyadenylation element-binding protein 1 n=1 Tax=Setaria digitata TaxID=48799 RepID=A0A915PSH6_9BILA